MSDIRINALATTATASASDDYVAIDGSANGTRKLSAYSPTFGGNVTVTGALLAHQTGTLNMAYEGSSISQLVAYGADASTLGRAKIVLRKAGTGTDAVTAADFTSTGATLAGNLTVSGTGTSTFTGDVSVTRSTGNPTFNLTNGASGGFPLVQFIDQRVDGNNWNIENGRVSGQLSFYSSGGGGTVMSLSSTGNLTVSGTGTSSFGSGVNLLSIIPSTGICSFYSTQATPSFVIGNTSAINKYGQIQWINSVSQLSIGTQSQYGTGALNIATNGNVLLGTTIDGGQKLQVSGTANISSTLTVNGAAANYALNAVGFVEAQGTTSSKGFRIYNTANGEAVNFQSNGITQTYDGTFDISSSNTTGLRIYGNAGSPLWRWVPWNGGSAGIVTNDSSGYINTSKSLPLLPITAPAAPASGWLLYTDSADSNKLKAKASTGTVVTLGTP